MNEKRRFLKCLLLVGIALVLLCLLQNVLCAKSLRMHKVNAAKRGVSRMVLRRIGQLSEEYWNQHGTFPFSLYELVRNATNLPPHLLQSSSLNTFSNGSNGRLAFVKQSNYWIEKLSTNEILVSERMGLRTDNQTLFCIFSRTPEGQTSSSGCWEKLMTNDCGEEER